MPHNPRDGPHDDDGPFPVYDHLPYQDFLNDHLLPNTPFLLSAKATSHWACTAWRGRRIAEDHNTSGVGAGPSAPNLDALRRYADDIVPVANTLRREFSEFSRTERPLGEVLDLWKAGGGEGLYVKDWHIFAGLESRHEGVGSVYEVPECFRDDWLNPPYTPDPRTQHGTPAARSADACSDFRFCYLGPAGTFTPLHRDVYASYSWSANVVGRKMWWFFPPDRLERVKDRHGDLVFDVRQLVDEGGAIKVLQKEGEVIFVPSGWHHQVLNLDFCISINHNFFASPTLPRVMTALQEAQARVEASIADVKEMIRDRVGVDGPWEAEWVEEVQKLLEMDAGWGWRGFWETVRANVHCPPADQAHSPPVHMRDSWVEEVAGRYRSLPEWDLLPDVRLVVEQVEGLIGGSRS